MAAAAAVAHVAVAVAHVAVAVRTIAAGPDGLTVALHCAATDEKENRPAAASAHGTRPAAPAQCAKTKASALVGGQGVLVERARRSVTRIDYSTAALAQVQKPMYLDWKGEVGQDPTETGTQYLQRKYGHDVHLSSGAPKKKARLMIPPARFPRPLDSRGPIRDALPSSRAFTTRAGVCACAQSRKAEPTRKFVKTT